MTTIPGLAKTKKSTQPYKSAKRAGSPVSNQGFAMASDELSLQTDELSNEEVKSPISKPTEPGSFSLA